MGSGQRRQQQRHLGALCLCAIVVGLLLCTWHAMPVFIQLPCDGQAKQLQLQRSHMHLATTEPISAPAWGASSSGVADARSFHREARGSRMARNAMKLDLTGKVAFIAGVADTSGYGWAIAKELANAGATIIIGTWPPVLKLFTMTLKKSSTDEAKKLDDGSLMQIAKIYPLDATFDIPEDVPEDVKTNKRYAGVGSFTIQEVVDEITKDYGKVDILVHSLANGPEVTKPLLETSRKGYLAASSASAYSMVSMVQRFAPIMPRGGSVISLSYIAAEKTIPGYGGGMSSAKAQLESDTRTLAYEAGRKFGIRINTISAGPLKSRAASAIGGDGEKTFIERAIDYSVSNAPLAEPLYADHVGKTALCLLTDLTAGVTGMTVYVDMGLHAMGQSLDSPAFEGVDM